MSDNYRDLNNLKPYQVTMLTATSSEKLPNGYDLITVRWRATEKSGNAARPAVCVALPSLKVTTSLPRLAVVMQEALDDIRAKVVSDWINEQISGNTGVSTTSLFVPPSLVTEEGIETWFNKSASEGRIKKADIEAWFKEDLHDNLCVAVMEKLGEDKATEEMVAKIADSFRLAVMKLAAPAFKMDKTDMLKLQKIIKEQATDGSRVKVALLRKLDGAINAPEKEDGLMDF